MHEVKLDFYSDFFKYLKLFTFPTVACCFSTAEHK